MAESKPQFGSGKGLITINKSRWPRYRAIAVLYAHLATICAMGISTAGLIIHSLPTFYNVMLETAGTLAIIWGISYQKRARIALKRMSSIGALKDMGIIE